MNRAPKLLAISLILVLCWGGVPFSEGHHRFAAHANNIDWASYKDMAVELMRQYLRVNTSNPPGNELAAASFLKAIFDREGIQSEIFEYLPGRANIIARIKGDGRKRPNLTLSQMDGVTADASEMR